MEPFRKFGGKVFTKNEAPGLSPKKPKLRDKILPNSQSTPLPSLGPEVYARNKPVYNGKTPLKKELIRVKLPDHPEKVASSHFCESYDVDEAIMFSTPPREAPGLEARPKISPPKESALKGPASKGPTSKGPLPKYPASKPFAPPKHKNNEVAKPITNVSRREEESDDSASLYSVNGATVYNEKASRNFIINQFSSPPSGTSARLRSLRDVIKPVNELDLPPEVQKDLLPPNPITFSDRFRAAKECEKEKTRIEREKIFLEREAQLPPPRPFPESPLAKLGRPLAKDQVMQSTPPRVEQWMAQRAGVEVSPPEPPKGKLGRNISNLVLASRATKSHHAPSASDGQTQNLKPSPGARFRDGPAMSRGAFEQGLRASPRPADARQVDPTYVTTSYTGAPTRPLDIRKAFKDSSHEAAAGPDTSDGPSYTYSTGHFRMHSCAGEYARLPPHLKEQYLSYDGRVPSKEPSARF